MIKKNEVAVDVKQLVNIQNTTIRQKKKIEQLEQEIKDLKEQIANGVENDEKKKMKLFERTKKAWEHITNILSVAINHVGFDKELFDKDIEIMETLIEKDKLIKINNVKHLQQFNFLWAKCPKCDNTIYLDSNYCDFCGQKLDWSDIVR